MKITKLQTTKPKLSFALLFGILGILSLLLFTACTTEKIIVTNDANNALRNTISVSGSAEIEVAPDEAEIRFSIITEALNSSQAQQQNAQIVSQVIAALRAQGVPESAIETLAFSVDQIREWEQGQYVYKGYRVRNTIKVTTRDMTTVGDLLDRAVAAGANDVDGVSFQLSTEAQQKVREQLLQQAAEDAQNKATLLTQSLGVTLGKAITISEYNYVFTPRYYEGDLMLKSQDASASTPILARNLATSARISVVFSIA